MTVTTATREEYIGHALEAAIRSRIKDRAWYRRNRSPFPWSDFERENDVALRELFEIRREAIRQHRAETERVEAAYRQLRAAHEAAEWAEAIATGQYSRLPDVPLADPVDHFAWPQ